MVVVRQLVEVLDGRWRAEHFLEEVAIIALHEDADLINTCADCLLDHRTSPSDAGLLYHPTSGPPIREE